MKKFVKKNASNILFVVGLSLIVLAVVVYCFSEEPAFLAVIMFFDGIYAIGSALEKPA